jgi:hypothetical protein
MKRFMNKKVAAIAAAVGITLGLGGAAFAYFTSTGTGSGSGAVGTASNDITVVGTETTPVFPGGATGSVSFTASNGNTTNPERLSTIHFTGAVADSGHATAGCDAAMLDLSMNDVTVNQTLAANASGVSLTPTGTLVMGDTGSSQNPCEGATLTLSFTTS